MLSRITHRSSWTLMAFVVVTGLLPHALAGQAHPDPIRLADQSDAQRASTVRSFARTPEDLDWIAAPGMPGVQLAYILGNVGGNGDGEYTYRLRFPSNFQLRLHDFANRRYITVLQGTYHMGLGHTSSREAAAAFGPGTYLVIPARTPMFGWTEGETILQVHGNGPFKIEWLGTYVADPGN